MKLPATLLAAALCTLRAAALAPGDAITPDAIANATTIQGELPAAWEPGKLYIIECWATWCGPCIAAIPHVDALYDKFHEKGLRVIGMNVMEDGKEHVAEFVKQKGDGMSYPVAYVGKGGAFESAWLEAANVRGIPRAFVIKDGKLLFLTHPAYLTEEMVASMLSGPAGIEEVVKRVAARQETSMRLNAVTQEFWKAAKTDDLAAMEAAIAKLQEMPGSAGLLPRLKLQVATTRKDWVTVAALLDGQKDDASGYLSMVVRAASVAAEENSGAPENLRRMLAADLAPAVGEKPLTNPIYYHTLICLQWSIGQKDSARQSAARMAEAMEKQVAAGQPAPAGTARKFLELLGKDELQSSEDFNKSVREELFKAAAAKRAGSAD